MNKYLAIVLIVIAFLIGGFIGYKVEKIKLDNLMMTMQTGYQKQINDLNAVIAHEQLMKLVPTPTVMVH